MSSSNRLFDLPEESVLACAVGPWVFRPGTTVGISLFAQNSSQLPSEIHQRLVLFLRQQSLSPGYLDGLGNTVAVPESSIAPVLVYSAQALAALRFEWMGSHGDDNAWNVDFSSDEKGFMLSVSRGAETFGLDVTEESPQRLSVTAPFGFIENLQRDPANAAEIFAHQTLIRMRETLTGKPLEVQLPGSAQRPIGPERLVPF